MRRSSFCCLAESLGFLPRSLPLVSHQPGQGLAPSSLSVATLVTVKPWGRNHARGLSRRTSFPIHRERATRPLESKAFPEQDGDTLFDTPSMARRTDQPLRAGLYARVSTEDKGQDPETQLRPLRDHAERRGFVVVGEFVDRASGTTEARPQYQRLLAAARRGSVLI